MGDVAAWATALVALGALLAEVFAYRPFRYADDSVPRTRLEVAM
jgi:hypothetical protein